MQEKNADCLSKISPLLELKYKSTMQKNFSVNLPILEYYKYYSLQTGRNTVFRRRLPVKTKNLSSFPAVTLQCIETLKNYRDAREGKRLVISTLT